MEQNAEDYKVLAHFHSSLMSIFKFETTDNFPVILLGCLGAN